MKFKTQSQFNSFIKNTSFITSKTLFDVNCIITKKYTDLFYNTDWNNYIIKFNPFTEDLLELRKRANYYKKNGNIIIKMNYGRMNFIIKQIRIYKRIYKKKIYVMSGNNGI
jgi:hypothetical protein